MENFIENLSFSLRHISDDVRVSGIGDGKHWDTVEFTTGSAKIDIVSVVLVNAGFSQHSIVLDFAFPKNWQIKQQLKISKRKYPIFEICFVPRG